MSIIFQPLLFLAMVGSRSWIVITVLAGCGTLVLSWRIATGGRKAILLTVFAGLIMLAIALPVTRSRFTGIFKNKFEFSEYNIDRLIIWSTAMNFILENPGNFILGYGTGSSNQLMDRLYQKNEMNWGFVQKNNTHNQYLNFLLNQGIFGLLLFCGYLIFPLLACVKSKFWFG